MLAFFGVLLCLRPGPTGSSAKVSIGVLRQAIPRELRLPVVSVMPAWGDLLIASGNPVAPASEWAEMGGALRSALKPDGTENPHRREPYIDPLTSWSESMEGNRLTESGHVISFYEPRIAALRQSEWAVPRFRDELVPTYEDMLPSYFPQLAGLRLLSKVLVLKAQVDLARGEKDASVADVVLAWRAGDRLASAQGGLVPMLGGDAMRSIAEKAMVGLAQRPEVSADDVAGLASTVSSARIRTQFLTALKFKLDSDVLWAIGSLPDPLAKPKPHDASDLVYQMLKGHPDPLDRKASVALAGQIYAASFENIDRPWGGQVDLGPRISSITNGLPTIVTDSEPDAKRPNNVQIKRARIQLAKVRNPLGRSLISPLAGSVAVGFTELPFRLKARRYGIALTLACIAYDKRTGQYPRELADLTPKDGIQKPLLDPFTDKPFRYDPAKLTIVSAGPKNDYQTPNLVFNLKATK